VEKKGKRRGKEKVANKTHIFSSLPHLFLIFSLSLPYFHLVLLAEKRKFSNTFILEGA
jgi:hypothetical protein